ncbi:hypothetical protein CLIB1423_42S00144 [[Candida] railenensis]|uniref:Dynactin subunit 4 n=1 Tax=[Candida] railenensis TaxID=45579 RepID=A0A9P0QUP7_9ASCO|nr:hypothetical protein CLIB1423_42S00144 [[Candida] railenensis]
MSKIYSNTQFICACTTSKLSSSDSLNARKYLFTENQSFPLHSLPKLYYCLSCRCIKCTACLTPKYESKFCPSCMIDHTGTSSVYCTKNCFDCPKCSSRLTITSKTIPPKSKQFKFSCTYCDFSYSTGIIDKPKSLLNILKSENEENNKEAEMFHQFQIKVKSTVSYNKLLSADVGPSGSSRKISPELLAKLTNLNLTNLTKKLSGSDNLTKIEKLENQIITIKPIAFDTNQDEEEANKRLNSEAIIPQQSSIHQHSYNHPFQTLPIPKTLRAKKSLLCDKCATVVIQPEPLPVSLKFPIKNNAVEVIPTVKVTSSSSSVISGIPNSVSIHLINPHNQKNSVKISTISQLPTQFFDNTSVSVNVTLPTASTVLLAPKSDSKKESILKSIPTSFLSEATQNSRTELMLRHGSSTDANTSYLEDSFDESFDTTVPIESSTSWSSVQMKFVVIGGAGENVDLKIPLHFALETSMDGQPFKLTYWSVVELGNFKIVTP